MEVIYSIFVPLFDYDYSTVFSTVKRRVLIVCEQLLHILLTRLSLPFSEPGEPRTPLLQQGFFDAASRFSSLISSPACVAHELHVTHCWDMRKDKLRSYLQEMALKGISFFMGAWHTFFTSV